MRLEKNLTNNKIVRKLFNFSIVFTLFFSCLTIFFVDTTKADQIPPTITIENPGLNSVIYDKTPTIKTTYYDVDGINLSSIIFKLDNIGVASSSDINSEGIIYTPTTKLTLGSHVVSLSVSDNFNNSAVKNWSFTIAESESSTEQNIGLIKSLEPKEIIIEEGTTIQTGIDRIIIYANKNLEKSNLFIAKLSTISNEITIPKISDITIINIGGGYLDIKTKTLYINSYLVFEFTSNGSKVKETDINSITLRFKIEKAWINSNNADKNYVKLLRYNDNGWQQLTTTYNSEDDNFVYYDAITKGFSVFSLVGLEKTAEKQSEGINFLLGLGVIIVIIIIIIAILFKKGILYIENEPEKETNKENYYISESETEKEIDEETKKRLESLKSKYQKNNK